MHHIRQTTAFTIVVSFWNQTNL